MPGRSPPTDVVESIGEQRFEDLLPRIGASLLLPGVAAELALARRSIPPALAALGEFLAAERLTVVGVESQFEVRDTLAPGTGVKGRIDLRAQTAAGRPVIVDLKWYRTDSYLRQDLKRGMALQIAVYARHVSDERVDAAAGYFALRQQRFLTDRSDAGGDRKSSMAHPQGDVGTAVDVVLGRRSATLRRGKVRRAHEQAATEAGEILGRLSAVAAEMQVLRLHQDMRGDAMSMKRFAPVPSSPPPPAPARHTI